MAYDVKVKIDLTKPVGKIGFGVPLILEEGATKAVPYTVVSSLEEIVNAGFAATTKVYKAAQLIFMQDNAPKKIAVCAAAQKATDWLAVTANTAHDWRQLIVVLAESEPSTIAAIMATIETLDGKMYFANLAVNEDTELTVSGIRRTVLFYCTPTEDAPIPVAALVGDTAGRTPGSFTYKNLILRGIEAQDITAVEMDAIHEKGGITFVAKAGDYVTSEGKTAGGEYIDVVDSEDYIIQQLAYKSQKILNNAAKVPYDNNGIAMLESAAVDVLQDAYYNGMIATKEDGTADYSVSYALREDTTEEQRATRVYLGGSFRFALAGAIHEADVTGTITA